MCNGKCIKIPRRYSAGDFFLGISTGKVKLSLAVFDLLCYNKMNYAEKTIIRT